jgi:E1-E2 ATPase
MSEQANPVVAPPAESRPPKVRTRPTASLVEPAILRRAASEAFIKLNPRTMIRNPVMFTVEIGSVITSVEFFGRPDVFVGLVTLWLWATVLFANFAEAVAEGRGKAQADTLRRSRKETPAYLLQPDGTTQEIPSTQLRAGNLVVVTAGQVIPGDGDVVEGLAVVDESAITGESAPVIRESGGDRSAVTGGTVVLSDRIVVQVTSNPGETFLDRMIALVEGASRHKTPNEIALDILIAGLTLILLVAVVTLQPMAIYDQAIQSTAVLVALFVCLAPTTIGGLLSAIGIAGMDRMVQRNVLAMSGRAVRADDRRDDGHHGRCYRFGARQLHPGWRHGSVRRHPARRDQSRRGRGRPLRRPGPRAAVGVRRRADGRADPGVPGQEDPRAADEARGRVRAGHPGHGPDLRRHLPGDQGRHLVRPQPRLPRPERDQLRLYLGG